MNLTEGQKQIGKENFSDVVEMTRRDFLGGTVAAGLAKDRARLSEWRTGARAALRGSTLLDASGYCARIHAALRHGWIDYCTRRTNAEHRDR